MSLLAFPLTVTYPIYTETHKLQEGLVERGWGHWNSIVKVKAQGEQYKISIRKDFDGRRGEPWKHNQKSLLNFRGVRLPKDGDRD